MVYEWYILPIGGLYGTYHLLREPGNSIDPSKCLVHILEIRLWGFYTVRHINIYFVPIDSDVCANEKTI